MLTNTVVTGASPVPASGGFASGYSDLGRRRVPGGGIWGLAVWKHAKEGPLRYTHLRNTSLSFWFLGIANHEALRPSQARASS